MVDHCISALKKSREELQFRSYIADTLRAISENTAILAGEHGKYIQNRYIEIHDSLFAPQTQEETPDGNEIIERMKSKLANL